MDNIELINKAIDAKKRAYTPYSNFNVGSAILTKSGKVFTGCNVECSSFGISICAERTALVKAISEGCMDIDKIAIVGGLGDNLIYTTPCGACRQFLSEFNQNMDIIMGFKNNDNIEYKEMKLKELLPETFEFGK